MIKRLYHGQVLDEITFNDIIDHFRGLEKMKVEKVDNKYIFENGSSVSFIPKTETENEKVVYEIVEQAEGLGLTTTDYLTYNNIHVTTPYEIGTIVLKNENDMVIAPEKYTFHPENLSITFHEKQTYSRVYLGGFSFLITKEYEITRDEEGNILSGDFDLSEIILLNEISKKTTGENTSSFDVFTAKFSENIALDEGENIRLHFDINTQGNRFYDEEEGCFVAPSPMYADFRVNLDVQASADSRLYISFQIVKKDGTDGLRSFVFGQKLAGWTVITGQKVLYLDEGDKVFVDVRVDGGVGKYTLESDDSFFNAIVYTNNVPFGGSSGDDTTIHGIPVEKPTPQDDGKVLSYDHQNNRFIWVENKAGDTTDGGIVIPDGVYGNVHNVEELFDGDKETFVSVLGTNELHIGFYNPTELVSKIRILHGDGINGNPYKIDLVIEFIRDGIDESYLIEAILNHQKEVTIELPFPMNIKALWFNVIDKDYEGSGVPSDYRWLISEMQLIK